MGPHLDPHLDFSISLGDAKGRSHDIAGFQDLDHEAVIDLGHGCTRTPSNSNLLVSGRLCSAARGRDLRSQPHLKQDFSTNDHFCKENYFIAPHEG